MTYSLLWNKLLFQERYYVGRGLFEKISDYCRSVFLTHNRVLFWLQYVVSWSSFYSFLWMQEFPVLFSLPCQLYCFCLYLGQELTCAVFFLDLHIKHLSFCPESIFSSTFILGSCFLYFDEDVCTCSGIHYLDCMWMDGKIWNASIYTVYNAWWIVDWLRWGLRISCNAFHL